MTVVKAANGAEGVKLCGQRGGRTGGDPDGSADAGCCGWFCHAAGASAGITQEDAADSHPGSVGRCVRGRCGALSGWE